MQRTLAFLAAALLTASFASAWSAHGHRTITALALDTLPPDMPAWLRDPWVSDQIVEQSNEPDRWRGTRLPALGHENSPDHYLDIDLLDQFGLTLETVPPLRYEYLRAMAVAKHVHPEHVEPYDPAKDPERSKEWPGFLPHAVAEHYTKLRSAFNTLRILESLNDPARAHQVDLARLNVIYHMGALSHFVGDAAQPLHTTKHHHGWVGENPHGYTTDPRFHAYIDGDIVDLHALDVGAVRPRVAPAPPVDASDPWPQTITYLRRSFERVEPLYQMEKDGRLRGDEGRDFIAGCFADAASMLAALYHAAYVSAAPTEREVQAWVRYNDLKPVETPEATPPASPR